MTFKTRNLKYRPWPVTVTLSVCSDDGEVTEEAHVFIGHFLPFTEADLLAARREIFGGEETDEDKKRIGALPVAEYAELDARFFARLMCGWDKVVGADDAPAAFGAEALRDLATGPDGPAFRRGVHAALLEIRFGIAPRKNAATSPSPGPKPGAGEAAPTI